MSLKAHGQIRRSQVITTYGPGALIDLPHYSAIVGGIDDWLKAGAEEILEPRLSRKLQIMTGVASPRLYTPPGDTNDPHAPPNGINAWRFPEWFVVQEVDGKEDRERSRRMVHRKALDDRGRFDGQTVVPTRFVRACPKGHVDDIDWRRFAHGGDEAGCHRQLWLDERGTGGDLSDLVVRCECGKSRGLYEASLIENNPLENCRGLLLWLGKDFKDPCTLPSRLLIRTASNAYFPHVVSVLSLPDRGTVVESAVRDLWSLLQVVDSSASLTVLRKLPNVTVILAPFSDDDVLKAISEIRGGREGERPVKQVELEALLAVPEGYGDDIPVDHNFHGRRLPEQVWRHTERCAGIQAVIQLHRLREILALIGFTRFEAFTPDINGEYETDVERAQIACDPKWFPAVENRGEGIFVQIRADALGAWQARPAVVERIEQLEFGHKLWSEDRKTKRPFPGGPYVLLHTLSHLLIQSLSMRCGYPASSIRERIYADADTERFGILLFTGSPDAEGTLGGLVQEARHIEDHLLRALQMGALCSNDPICSGHNAGRSMEKRWLQGAACHGCALVAETSCEMRNDYLDRALVVPVLGVPTAAFFAANL